MTKIVWDRHYNQTGFSIIFFVDFARRSCHSLWLFYLWPELVALSTPLARPFWFFFFFALSPILKTEDWLSPQIFGAGCGQCVFVYIFPYEPIRFHNHPIQFSFRQQNGVQCRKCFFFFCPDQRFHERKFISFCGACWISRWSADIPRLPKSDFISAMWQAEK